jgi:hypothetical protein
MVQLFADRYRDERPSGDFFRFMRFWGGMVGDILRTALAERTESAMSSFKQNWWKWAIGVFAVLQGVFVVEGGLALFLKDDSIGTSLSSTRVPEFLIPLATMTCLLVGLRILGERPRTAAALLTVGLLPVALFGFIFFWFPPMYLVSVVGIYLIVRVFMETGRITRAAIA